MSRSGNNDPDKLKTHIKSEMEQRGNLFGICKVLCELLINCFHIYIYQRKPDLKKPKIYDKWKADWKKGEKKEEEEFVSMFEYDYKYSCEKAKKNRKMNFRIKFLSFIPFILVTFLYLMGMIIYNISLLNASSDFSEFVKKMNWKISIYGTIFYVVAVVLTIVILKWLDVKKYQETWSRHSAHQFAIEMEMIRYLLRMDEYATDERRQRFIGNIMKSWEENENKFVENMKKEEKIDILKAIKK